MSSRNRSNKRREFVSDEELESSAGSTTEASPPATSSEAPPVPTSFGDTLRRAREARKLTLDDVAHLTKIRRAILEALEADARNELPEKVFVLGYVRSYASTVGMDIEGTLRQFNAAWIDEDGDAPGESDAEGAGMSFGWVPPAFASVLAALAIWYIVGML